MKLLNSFLEFFKGFFKKPFIIDGVDIINIREQNNVCCFDVVSNRTFRKMIKNKQDRKFIDKCAYYLIQEGFVSVPASTTCEVLARVVEKKAKTPGQTVNL